MKLFIPYIKYTFWLFILIISFFSCRGKEKVNSSDLPVIYVNLVDSEEKLDLAKYVSSDWEFVSLNKDDDILIRSIRKVLYDNELYYIFDSSSIIYIVDKEGNLVNSLNRVGNGPGEYNRIYNMHVNDQGLWICDSEKMRVHCYDKDLNFLESYSTPVFVMDLIVEDNSLILSSDVFYFQKETSGLHIYNLVSNESELLFPISPMNDEYIKYLNTKQLTKNKDMVFVRYNYNDTIYRIEANQIFPQFTYVFSERYSGIPHTPDELKEDKYKKLIKGINNLYCTNESVIFQFNDYETTKTTIYNIKKGETSTYSGFIHSALGNPELKPAIITPEYMICLLNPQLILEKDILDMDNIKDQRFKQEFINILNNLEEDDNPLLLKFNLRPDSEL